jgi:hypothetical protein
LVRLVRKSLSADYVVEWLQDGRRFPIDHDAKTLSVGKGYNGCCGSGFSRDSFLWERL